MAKEKQLPAVRKNTLPANWESKMKEDAAKGRAREAAVGVSRRLKTQGGVLTYMDTPVPGNKMPVIILSVGLENAYYKEEFDPNNPATPDCFAFATGDGEDDEKSMVPHKDSPDKQHSQCDGCPQNKFGTADKGRGKACKNQRHLVIIHADALKAKGGVTDAETVTAQVPPTSLRGWAAYVKRLEGLSGKPTYAYVTELAVVPRQQGGHTVTFSELKEIDKKAMSDVYLKAKEADKEVAERPPYQPMEALAPKAGSKKGAAKKSKFARR